MYCDLVILGSESWDKYHSEIQLGGQKETIMEIMGGGHIGKCGRQGLQSGAVSFGQAQKEKAEPQGERA